MIPIALFLIIRCLQLRQCVLYEANYYSGEEILFILIGTLRRGVENASLFKALCLVICIIK